MSCLRKGSIRKETFRTSPEGGDSAGHADVWRKRRAGCFRCPSRSAFAVFRDQQGASVAGAERMKQRVVRCEVRAQGRGLVGRHGIFAVSLEGYGFD